MGLRYITYGDHFSLSPLRTAHDKLLSYQHPTATMSSLENTSLRPVEATSGSSTGDLSAIAESYEQDKTSEGVNVKRGRPEPSVPAAEQPKKRMKKEGGVVADNDEEKPAKKRMVRYYLKVLLWWDGKYVPAKIQLIRPQTIYDVDNRINVWIRLSTEIYETKLLLPLGRAYEVSLFEVMVTYGVHKEWFATKCKKVLEDLLGDVIQVQVMTR